VCSSDLSSIVRLKDFLYQEGDKFLVQISAWSSEKRALKHASYFKKRGYQTEIVKVNLDSKTWYRVRVINFNSENEAEKFYKKYK
jgi:cell division septation protein DedD